MKGDYSKFIQMIFFDKIEATWKYEYYRHLKDKPKTQNRFCGAKIKGIRLILEDKYKFDLKEDHSEICKDIFKEKLEKKGLTEIVIPFA